MNGRCINCEHWSPNLNSDATHSKHHRRCLHPKVKDGYGINDIPLDGLVVEADEGWGLATGENFGCVNFEVKLSWLKQR